MTPSSHHWFRKLASASFKGGQWVLSDENKWRQDPFLSLLDDLRAAIDEYNQFAETKITLVHPPAGSDVIAVIAAGTAQAHFTRQGAFLDLILVKTVHFQNQTKAIARYNAVKDPLGEIIWRRGSAEISNEQIIRNAVLALLESA